MSFLYGLFSLFIATGVFASSIIEKVDQTNYNNRWTVGQIMPVALLAVPFINVVDMFYHGKAIIPSSYEFTSNGTLGKATEDTSSQPNLVMTDQDSNRAPEQTHPSETLRQGKFSSFDPDQDYYLCSTALVGCNIMIFLFELSITGIVLGVTAANDSIARFLAKEKSSWAFIAQILVTALSALWVYILITFLVDWAVTRNALRTYFGKRTLLGILHTLNAAIVTVAYIMLNLPR